MKNVAHYNQGPVFIVGMNGSGTTMILDHLGHHPDLFGFRIETYVLPWYLSSEHKYGDLALDRNFLGLWNDMRKAYPFRAANKGPAFDLPEDWSLTPRHACGVFDRILREYAAREGKTRWCEKTPMHVLHIARIAHQLPQARFIHIMRDGRDCAASCHRRWRRHPSGTIFRWRRAVEEGRRQGALLPARYMELRYEEVTSDPERQLRAICRFLGIAFDESVLSVGRPRKHVTGRDSKTIVPNQKRNESYFSGAQLTSLESIAGQQLAKLGYPTRFPDSNVAPSVFSRSWWATHDAWHILVRRLHDKLTVDKHVSWSLFFGRLLTTVRSKLK